NLLQRLAISLGIYPDCMPRPNLPCSRLWLVVAGSAAATCAGPYNFHLYKVVFGYSSSKVIYSMITELQALSFAGISHFLELLLVAGNTEFNTRGLDRVISAEFPVDAVNYLRTHPVGGPLYNSFDWGGFLSFYMPEYPVAIDGRTDLYGDAMDSQFLASEGAEASYATDPYLNEAG